VPTVIENIATEIVRRLQRITVANGYTFDVANVQRADRLGTSIVLENYLVLVVQQDSQPNEELSHPGNPPAIAFDATFNVHCFVRESDREESVMSTTSNEMAGQAMKAIANETNAPYKWWQMNGNSILTEFGTIGPYSESEGVNAGVTLPLIVSYRVSENDPYEVRA
jgi:hypothetical protein